VVTEINNVSTSCMVWSNGKHSFTKMKSTSSKNLLKRMKVRKIIGHSYLISQSIDMLYLHTGKDEKV